MTRVARAHSVQLRRLTQYNAHAGVETSVLYIVLTLVLKPSCWSADPKVSGGWLWVLLPKDNLLIGAFPICVPLVPPPSFFLLLSPHLCVCVCASPAAPAAWQYGRAVGA